MGTALAVAACLLGPSLARGQGPLRAPAAPPSEQYVLTLQEVPRPGTVRSGAYRLGAVSTAPIVVLHVAAVERIACVQLTATLLPISGPRRYELRLARASHREQFCEESPEPPTDTVHLPPVTGTYQLDVVSGERRDRYRYTVSEHHALLQPAGRTFTRVASPRLQRAPHHTVAVLCGSAAFDPVAITFERDGVESGDGWACRLLVRVLRDSLGAYVLPIDSTAGALPFGVASPGGAQRLRLLRFAHPKGPEPYFAADVKRVHELVGRFRESVLEPYARRAGLRVITWEGELLGGTQAH